MANALEELKKRVTHQVVALCFVVGACYVCGVELIVLCLKPLNHFCYLKVGEAFTAHMLVVLFFSLFFWVPVLAFHCWGFLSPGIGASIRRGLLIRSVAAFFLAGLVPLVFSQIWCNVLIVFFMGYSIRHEFLVLEFIPTINAFLWFKIKIAGCLFVALTLAILWGSLSATGSKVRRRRTQAYTVAVLFGSAFAPGAAAQFGCSFLMIFVFELAISISYGILRLRAYPVSFMLF
uniref:SecY-independent transporter protein n=1 Tax=Caulerpa lentillifera TaxID=148947 RepID=A0A2Z2QKG7_9CHLO|nr:hypothetical protein [Caulerpa lentillifera]AST24230.1 hypothetical protein [Caulerpa lentillifera]QKS32230.1 hypothetical protein [Caulerpa lentillifera]